MIFYYRDIGLKLGRLWNMLAVVLAAYLALRWTDFVRRPGAVMGEMFALPMPVSAVLLGVGLLLCWYFIFSLFGLDRAGRTLFDSRTLLDILLSVVIGTAALGWPMHSLEQWLWDDAAREATQVTPFWLFAAYFGTLLFLSCTAYRVLAYLLLEFGRPGTGTRVSEIEKITMLVKQMGFEILEDNPMYGLLEDEATGKFKPEYVNEKILSGILEFRFNESGLEDFLGKILPKLDELDTVVSVGLVSRFQADDSIPVIEKLEKKGIKVRPNAKINVGLGRPLVER